MSGRTPTRHWAEIEEAGALFGMRALFATHRWCGRWPFRLLLLPVLLYFYAVRGIARRASHDYLRRILGPAGRLGGHWRSFRHFWAFGECLLDKALAWSGGLSLDRAKVHGLEPLLARLHAGQGALLLVAHLGNLEVSRALARRTPGIRQTLLVHTRHAERFARVLAALDPESQAGLLQVTELTPATAVELGRRIAGGEVVVIAADRAPVAAAPRVVAVPFLGEDAALPIGPYVLAGLLHCPVYLLFCLRLTDAYHLFVEPFAVSLPLPRSGREAAIRRAAADFALRLEHYCRLAPLQWFNFYPFWRTPTFRGTSEDGTGPVRSGAPQAAASGSRDA
jgi:predicted LPLAT superfamily acyltransferase